MSDYGLKITIHDLDSAVSDAVCRAHREYEPKFYDWMQNEIEAHVDDKVFYAVRDKFEKFDSDNANTEQRIGVNEVKAMIDSAVEEKVHEGVRNAIDDLDFNMLIRDYGDVDSLIEDFMYNNDLVDKDWVEGELDKVHRDVRDEVLMDVREMTQDNSVSTNDIENLHAQIMGMQAEIDFLHEKYNDIYNRSLRGRVTNAWDSFTLTCRRVVRGITSRIPRITITRGGA